MKSTVKCDLNWSDKIVLIILQEIREQSYLKLLWQLVLNVLLSRRLRYPLLSSPFPPTFKETTKLLQVIFAQYNRNSNSRTMTFFIN